MRTATRSSPLTLVIALAAPLQDQGRETGAPPPPVDRRMRPGGVRGWFLCHCSAGRSSDTYSRSDPGARLLWGAVVGASRVTTAQVCDSARSEPVLRVVTAQVCDNARRGAASDTRVPAALGERLPVHPELGHGFAELALESLWLGRMVEIGAWFRH